MISGSFNPERFVAQCMWDGGATDGDVTEGYMVGGVVTPMEIPLNQGYPYPEMLRWFVQTHREELKRLDTHIGGWVDKTNDMLVFDISEMTTDYASAMRRAISRKEKAIYDVAKGEEIFTPKGTN